MLKVQLMPILHCLACAVGCWKQTSCMICERSPQLGPVHAASTVRSQTRPRLTTRLQSVCMRAGTYLARMLDVPALRFKVEFHLFFTALSVRPGSSLAITVANNIASPQSRLSILAGTIGGHVQQNKPTAGINRLHKAAVHKGAETIEPGNSLLPAAL